MKKGNQISKGSTWRKWDLQVHTPNTKLGNQYVAKKGEDVWELFFSKIKDSDVDVIGITDYYSIDNYELVMAAVAKDKELAKKTFFPNIEFRLEVSVNSSHEQLQCHLLFDNDPNLIEEIREFLSHLPLTNKKANDEDCYCTDKDIRVCGGYDKVSISISDLKGRLKKSFGERTPYIIVGIANGMGSIRATANSNIKKELSDQFDKQCDAFFGKSDNTDWYLKTNRYENTDIKSVPKAVVATSDAHSFIELEETLGKQELDEENKIIKDVTWIKAEKTFEGLKQIICEPTERVHIGLSKPDTKKSYFLVDKVRFIDNSGSNIFPSDYIEINQNLTSIVGGKSTGKSMLLYYIAKTVDNEEVSNRYTESVADTPYDIDDSPDFNFEVVWADGHVSMLKPTDDTEDERKILYIPQNYLNKLSEKNVKSRATLNKFVMDVLLQDPIISELYQKNQNETKSILRSLPTAITSMYQLKQEMAEIADQIKKVGDQKGIEKYIIELQKQADQIKQKSKLSTEEIAAYEKLISKEAEINKSIVLYSDDKKRVRDFGLQARAILDQLRQRKDTIAENLSTDEAITLLRGELNVVDTYSPSFTEKIEKVEKLIGDRIKQLGEDLSVTQKALSPFASKFQYQSELNKKSDEIKDEQKKLDQLLLLNKEIKEKQVQYQQQKNVILSSYKSIYEKYDELKNEFKKYEDRFQDISLSVTVGFNDRDFNQVVVHECLNKADIKRLVNDSWTTEYQYIYDPTKHLDFIEKVFEGIIDGSISTIKNRSGKDAVVKLMDNFFSVDFKISYKNDSLDKMSPGKKGLVLLRLLIELSNEEWPILLDQPEDDLDNRSVYDDLVEFMKIKKKSRQMLIVTHNPNLVVGADAEEVVVANQEGQELGRENRKYRFEYVSGAIEDSFEDVQEPAILYKKGIREHVCEVLEGGEEAFKKREQKYRFT